MTIQTNVKNLFVKMIPPLAAGCKEEVIIKNEAMLSAVRSINLWEVKSLKMQNFHSKKKMEIVREISHIHFTKLITLKIEGNQIDSVESLIGVSMPNIREISLCQNLIGSIREFRKALWPSLRHLHLQQNYIYDIQTLSSGCFPTLKCLWVYVDSQHAESMIDDLCFPVKMETNSLNSLWICEKQFAFRRYIKKAMMKRWKSLEFFGDYGDIE